MKRYENFVGLTEVKAAQARVVEREKKFIEQQELRREAQAKITEVQKRIKVSSLLRMKYYFKIIFFPLRTFTWSWRKPTEGRTDTWCWSHRNIR